MSRAITPIAVLLAVMSLCLAIYLAADNSILADSNRSYEKLQDVYSRYYKMHESVGKRAIIESPFFLGTGGTIPAVTELQRIQSEDLQSLRDQLRGPAASQDLDRIQNRLTREIGVLKAHMHEGQQMALGIYSDLDKRKSLPVKSWIEDYYFDGNVVAYQAQIQLRTSEAHADGALVFPWVGSVKPVKCGSAHSFYSLCGSEFRDMSEYFQSVNDDENGLCLVSLPGHLLQGCPDTTASIVVRVFSTQDLPYSFCSLTLPLGIVPEFSQSRLHFKVPLSAAWGGTFDSVKKAVDLQPFESTSPFGPYGQPRTTTEPWLDIASPFGDVSKVSQQVLTASVSGKVTQFPVVVFSQATNRGHQSVP